LPLDASGYDGGGLVTMPSGRIGYLTSRGVRVAVGLPVTYLPEGTCTTYRLDSGRPRNVWGRMFVEACLPEGTELYVGASTSDDEHASAIAMAPPVPARCAPVGEPSGSPPLPPERLTPVADRRLHRRPFPSTPWWYPDERHQTLEAPVAAPAGRYLWLTLRLVGRNRRSPRVREIRVEQRGHQLLRRLPGVFSEQPETADFLRRYLEPLDGVLHDLDVRSSCRDVLLDPHGTPAEALDWLASFLGLALDDRWAEAARRQLVSEIAELYRRRGTLGALVRYIELFLAGDRAAATDQARSIDPWVTPVIVEHFRLRGLGGPLLGNDPTLSSRSVLGAGFRVGGSVGRPGDDFLDPSDDAATSFTSHAHRFTVLIPRPLTAEEELAVRHILDTERPAHTAYELCTVDAGMRIGRGLHLGLSSVVGPTGSFAPTVTDRTRVGLDALVGGRASGIAVEASRLGQTARIG
ncbi:MAG: phage tail protein, partial [Actinomycetota bacterium]